MDLTMEKVSDGLMPELSGTEVVIKGKAYQICEMPVFYNKQFGRKLKLITDVFTGGAGFNLEDLLDPDKMDAATDRLMEPAFYVMNYHFSDEFRTIEEFEKIASQAQMLKILQAQMEANGTVNFFKMLLRAVVESLSMTLQSANPPATEPQQKER